MTLISKYTLAAMSLVVATGCLKQPTRVELPAGYIHDGKMQMAVREVDPEDYFDKVAARALRDSFRKYTGLFQIVDSIDEAQLDLIASGRINRSFKVDSFGSEVAIATLEPRQAGTADSTVLTFQIWHPEEGKIYDGRLQLPGPPNLMMPAAANQLAAFYSVGR